MGRSDAFLAVAFTAGLAVCGVRDWRCYAAGCLSLPFVSGLASGNVSLLLAGLCGFAWIWRNSFRGSLALAATLIIKPILWPLIVWHILRGRYRRAAEAAGVTAGVCLLGWAAIGFRGLVAYPALLHADANHVARNGVSLARLLLAAGVTLEMATAIGVALGGFLLWLSWRRGDDLDVFAVAMVTALLASPIVFVHYFTVMLIPLAARHPRFSWLWLIPMALWPIRHAYLPDLTRPAWTACLGLVVIIGLLASSLRLPSRREAPTGTPSPAPAD